jgi:hypothetical protein
MKPPISLTVIIRDDSPIIFAGDSPYFRRVTIQLTDEQKEALKLRKVGIVGKEDIFESVSRSFLEFEEGLK